MSIRPHLPSLTQKGQPSVENLKFWILLKNPPPPPLSPLDELGFFGALQIDLHLRSGQQLFSRQDSRSLAQSGSLLHGHDKPLASWTVSIKMSISRTKKRTRRRAIVMRRRESFRFDKNSNCLPVRSRSNALYIYCSHSGSDVNFEFLFSVIWSPIFNLNKFNSSPLRRGDRLVAELSAHFTLTESAPLLIFLCIVYYSRKFYNRKGKTSQF